MYIVMVSVQIRPEAATEFLEAVDANARQTVTSEPGCLTFEIVHLGAQDYLYVERYQDLAAFELHRRSPHLAAWREFADRVVVPGSQKILVGPVVAGQ